MTPPDIAAEMCFYLLQNEENLDEYTVGDFGCGTGMLTAGLIYIGVK